MGVLGAFKVISVPKRGAGWLGKAFFGCAVCTKLKPEWNLASHEGGWSDWRKGFQTRNCMCRGLRMNESAWPRIHTGFDVAGV